MTDAIALKSSLSQTRELNITAHELAQIIRTTGAGAEWTDQEILDQGWRWVVITSHALRDTTEWSNQHREQDSSKSEWNTV